MSRMDTCEVSGLRFVGFFNNSSRPISAVENALCAEVVTLKKKNDDEKERKLINFNASCESFCEHQSCGDLFVWTKILKIKFWLWELFKSFVKIEKNFII
jgi:hypothetical protein